MPGLTMGRILMLLSNILYSAGAFLADWSETHVLNPRWPPHAKFHNGQTMSLSVLLALCSTYFACIKASGSERENLFWAALIGSFYCVAGLSAILYPGTDWKDPEQTVGGGQAWLFSAIVIMHWVGYVVEVRSLGKAKAT